MKKIFLDIKERMVLLMALLLLGAFELSAHYPLYSDNPTLTIVDMEWKNFDYDPTVTANAPNGAITFEVWFKAGKNYIDNSGNWWMMNYRFDFVLEPGVELDASKVTHIPNPSNTNDLDLTQFNLMYDGFFPPDGMPAGFDYIGFSAGFYRLTVRPNDLTDEWQFISTMSFPLTATSDIPTSDTYVKPRIQLSGVGSWWGSGPLMNQGITLQHADEVTGELPLGGGTPPPPPGCPDYATWTGAVNSNWNNAGNWTNADGKIPGACTKVTIPAGAPRYPVLTGTKADNKCDIIYFEFGAEVAHTYLLTYNHAKVDMTIEDNRWYMLSAPLRNMYSGDYFLEGHSGRLNPAVYMMQYQATNPETNFQAAKGLWSNPFNTLHVDLSVGKGFATWVDEGTKPSGNWTFTFPKDSADYKYYDKTGAQTGLTVNEQLGGTPADVLSRTLKGRFTYESTAVNAATGGFTVPIAGDQTNYVSQIVGNPFMAHLDLQKFYDENSASIENSFYLWTKDAFAAFNKHESEDWYLIAGGGPLGVEGNTTYTVAPMQSFFVQKKVASVSSLNFTSAMEVTNPGNVLKSTSSKELTENVLKLDLYKNNDFQSGIAVRYDEKLSGNGYDNTDTWTLFPDNNKTSSTILYSLIDGKAATINSFGDLTSDIELGISTSKDDSRLKLVCRGDENFDSNCDIYLIDKKEGRTQNLRNNPEYVFEKATFEDLTGRFVLHIENNASGINNTLIEKINIYSQGGEIYVSGEKLKKVEVFNLQGQVIAQRDNIKSSAVTIPVKQGKTLVVVKAYSEAGVKTEKVTSE